jgi:L-threonylcarbamoyladenylate synthase
LRMIDAHGLDRAAAALDAGELVVVPTSRWYMLCCDATSRDACAAVYASKRRPLTKPLLLALPPSSTETAGLQVGAGAAKLIHWFWPGDLALLLPWADAQARDELASVGRDAALVCRPPGILGALAELASVPVAATSANISGAPSEGGSHPAITATAVKDFIRVSGADVTVLVDGGICPRNQHLTVIDCSIPDGPPLLVREGAVHRDAIWAALDESGQTTGPSTEVDR